MLSLAIEGHKLYLYNAVHLKGSMAVRIYAAITTSYSC